MLFNTELYEFTVSIRIENSIINKHEMLYDANTHFKWYYKMTAIFCENLYNQLRFEMLFNIVVSDLYWIRFKKKKRAPCTYKDEILGFSPSTVVTLI